MTDIKKFLHSYKSSLLMLLGVVAGGLAGWLWPASVGILAPIGKIFMNLLFVIIVPMIFFSVSYATCSMSRQSLLGRVLATTIITIIVLACLMSLIAYVGAIIYPPISHHNIEVSNLTKADTLSWSDMLVEMLTVSEFHELFSTRHILPLMVIAMFVGLAAARIGQEKVIKAIDSCRQITIEMMNCLMVIAPIGLGCYFADMIADNASMLLSGYGRVLLLYLVLTAFTYVFLNPLFATTLGIKPSNYWREIIKPSVLAISTLSSSACMPANIQAVKNLGIRPSIAEAIVPLGTQFFKQGTIMTCTIKVAFVILLTGGDIINAHSCLMIMTIGIVASMLAGAIPTGAGTAELFICSALGAPTEITGLVIVLSTLLDMPATLINVNGNTLLPIFVDRISYQPTSPNQSVQDE